MNLIIDVGNTLIKVAVFQNGRVVEKVQSQNDSILDPAFWNQVPLDAIDASIISTVTNKIPLLPQKIRNKPPLLLSHETLLPFKNLYRSPETLGNDRKALVAAASMQYPKDHVLVIDAGTCITYDFKNAQNEYLGGAISPGIRMRYKALNQFTSRLPYVEPGANYDLCGGSTKDSINTGVMLGTIKEVDGIIDEYRKKYLNIITILTGGDAEFLSVNLKNSIFANSNFLLEGLNHILEINISQ